jgi:hypothetical protein
MRQRDPTLMHEFPSHDHEILISMAKCEKGTSKNSSSDNLVGCFA